MFRSLSGNGNGFIQRYISWIFPAFVECPFVDIIFGICAFDFRRTGGIVQITAAFEGPQDIYTKTFIIEISGYIVGSTYVDSDGSVSTDYFPPKNNQTSSFQFNEDADIRRIERARQNMNQKEKDKMMRILEASFEDYFGDDYVDDDND